MKTNSNEAHVVVFEDGRYLGQANTRVKRIGSAVLLTRSEAKVKARQCEGKVDTLEACTSRKAKEK